MSAASILKEAVRFSKAFGKIFIYKRVDNISQTETTYILYFNDYIYIQYANLSCKMFSQSSL